MGTELDHHTKSAREITIPTHTRLDERTADLIREVVTTLPARHPEVRAIILYGSVARGEARPLSDREPSDVDLLVLIDLEPGVSYIPYDLHIGVFHSLGLAQARHPDAPREVQLMLAWRDLADWDPTFVESVARDGILLWSRGALPERLAAVETRSPQAASPA